MLHLDTDIVVAYLRGNRTVAEHIKARLPDAAISPLVFAELLYGAGASSRPADNIDRLRQFVDLIQAIDFDRTSADAYSRIRLSLRRKGRPAGDIDMLIAAVAVGHDAVLATHNTRHFEAIDELSLEDWLA